LYTNLQIQTFYTINACKWRFENEQVQTIVIGMYDCCNIFEISVCILFICNTRSRFVHMLCPQMKQFYPHWVKS